MCKCGSPSTCQVPGLSPLLSPAVPAGAGAEESRGTPLLSGPEGVFSEGIWFLERFRSERRPPHCPHGLCLSFPELPVVYTVCEGWDQKPQVFFHVCVCSSPAGLRGLQ